MSGLLLPYDSIVSDANHYSYFGDFNGLAWTCGSLLYHCLAMIWLRLSFDNVFGSNTLCHSYVIMDICLAHLGHVTLTRMRHHHWIWFRLRLYNFMTFWAASPLVILNRDITGWRERKFSTHKLPWFGVRCGRFLSSMGHSLLPEKKGGCSPAIDVVYTLLGFLCVGRGC